MIGGRWVLGFALALLAPLGMASAQETSAVAPASEDAFEGLYQSLQQGVDQEVLLDGMMASVRTQYAAIPEIAAAERLNPGLLDDLMVAFRPILGKYSDRVRLEYRPRMIAILRDGLTAGEARDLSAFYSSPLGQAVLGQVATNYRPDSVLATISKEKSVSAENVDADMKAMTAQTLAQMDPAQLREIVAKVSATPAFVKLNALGPRINALRAQMEEEPTTAAENAEIESAFGAVLAKYTD